MEAAKQQGRPAAALAAPTSAVAVLKTAGRKVDEHIIVYHKPDDARAATFTQFHTDIRNNYVDIATLGFTSAEAEEGKSVVALNFAVALARDCEERVCIVDCDLRKPSLHRLLGMDNPVGYGLSDSLAGTAPPSGFALDTPVEKLFLVPAGTPCANPTKLFASKRVEEVVAELRSAFTYTIFDCPPVLLSDTKQHPGGETKDLAPHLDGIVLVVQANKTSKRRVLKARQRLQPDSAESGVAVANILGFIFNKAKAE